ncbi:MAG: methyltransferase domain-containing protein [Gammaproteobacteria bacterium]|nr:methyltransferase domain-containing protein [Gammaproteobacteria bacterium]MCP5135721.1 methyltransferase domain-containing protein [Gammaproteobacteria bacterium]
MSVEVRLSWQDRDVRFIDRIVVGDAMGVRDGELDVGDLVPMWDASLVRDVPLEEMALARRYGQPLTLHAGRFYPRRLAGTGVADGDATQPMRVLDVRDGYVRIDLNAPLASFPASVQVADSDWESALDGAPLDTLRIAGIGMQAMPPGDLSVDWLDENSLRCEDMTADDQFYRPVRLVHHLDANARTWLTRYYGEALHPGMTVLDLMSSWTSHLPDQPDSLEVVGLGMNLEELMANSRLSERLCHDLNRNPVMSLEVGRFDLVLCTASVEYLRDPVAVLTDVARVLKPGGRVMIAFSDRWFPTKAVQIWGELHPFQRPALVLHYLRESGMFADYRAESIQGIARPRDDKYAAQRRTSDPMFVVSATRL